MLLYASVERGNLDDKWGDTATFEIVVGVNDCETFEGDDDNIGCRLPVFPANRVGVPATDIL